jgi:hypothetical protein
MLQFHQIMFFYFYKGNEGKIHSYIIRKYNIKICCKIFFQSCVMINIVKQIWFWELNGYIGY